MKCWCRHLAGKRNCWVEKIWTDWKIVSFVCNFGKRYTLGWPLSLIFRTLPFTSLEPLRPCMRYGFPGETWWLPFQLGGRFGECRNAHHTVMDYQWYTYTAICRKNSGYTVIYGSWNVSSWSLHFFAELKFMRRQSPPLIAIQSYSNHLRMISSQNWATDWCCNKCRPLPRGLRCYLQRWRCIACCDSDIETEVEEPWRNMFGTELRLNCSSVSQTKLEETCIYCKLM